MFRGDYSVAITKFGEAVRVLSRVSILLKSYETVQKAEDAFQKVQKKTEVLNEGGAVLTSTSSAPVKGVSTSTVQVFENDVDGWADGTEQSGGDYDQSQEKDGSSAVRLDIQGKIETTNNFSTIIDLKIREISNQINRTQ